VLGRYLQCTGASFLYHITSHHVFKEGVRSLLYLSSSLILPFFSESRNRMYYMYY